MSVFPTNVAATEAPPPFGIDLEVPPSPAGSQADAGSPTGSRVGPEAFDVSSNAPAVEEKDEKYKELEKKLEIVNQELRAFREMALMPDYWQQLLEAKRKAADAQAGGEAAAPGKETTNKEDELKPQRFHGLA